MNGKKSGLNMAIIFFTCIIKFLMDDRPVVASIIAAVEPPSFALVVDSGFSFFNLRFSNIGLLLLTTKKIKLPIWDFVTCMAMQYFSLPHVFFERKRKSQGGCNDETASKVVRRCGFGLVVGLCV